MIVGEDVSWLQGTRLLNIKWSQALQKIFKTEKEINENIQERKWEEEFVLNGDKNLALRKKSNSGLAQ